MLIDYYIKTNHAIPRQVLDYPIEMYNIFRISGLYFLFLGYLAWWNPFLASSWGSKNKKIYMQKITLIRAIDIVHSTFHSGMDKITFFVWQGHGNDKRRNKLQRGRLSMNHTLFPLFSPFLKNDFRPSRRGVWAKTLLFPHVFHTRWKTTRVIPLYFRPKKRNFDIHGFRSLCNCYSTIM